MAENGTGRALAVIATAPGRCASTTRAPAAFLTQLAASGRWHGRRAERTARAAAIYGQRFGFMGGASLFDRSL